MEYINLATASSAGEPWNTPVYAVSDSELKFYWSSWKEAEHSKNIRANSRIFFTLYDSTRKRGDNNLRCLYLRGEGVAGLSVMDLEQRAQELISSMEYINLATASSAGEPWNTPVYAVSDSELKFYWSSWKEAEHSKNIRANSRIFFTLYDSTRKRGDNNRRCLYLRGEGGGVGRRR